jgi:hypothetical protein
MTDKTKQSARQVQRESNLPYQVCLQLVRGELVLTARSDECLVAKGLAGARRWAQPKDGAAVKPCRCAKCQPEP